MPTVEGRARKRGRLSRSGEFERVYRQGASHSNRYLVLYAFPRGGEEGGESRLGISVGRKVGGAVERNRVKRALREAYAEVVPGLPEGHDFVLVARPGIEALIEEGGTPRITECLREIVSEAGLDRGERST
jgi:ribonuclease P protein component